MRYGRGIDKETCRRFVLMYVNDYTHARWATTAARRSSGSSGWRTRKGLIPDIPPVDPI